MKIIRGINKIKRLSRPVVALGVFDGMHLGHRRIIAAVIHKAHDIKGTSVVVTFWPHPQRVESLYSLAHRLRLIKELGIDVCIVVNFNRKFSSISAEDFVRGILSEKIGAQYIYVGENFRFGHGQEGDRRYLKRLSKIYNFKLKLFKVLKSNNKPISSTYIRSLIKKGELRSAQKLLSRPVSILGIVIRGSFLAGKLGFPTANINPHHEVIPASGIYAVKIVLGHRRFYGACYIGTNPTLKVKRPLHVETHIFNLHQNIYGKDLEIHFIKRIRGEKKFSSVFALTAQIRKDITFIKRLFSRHS